MKYRVDVILEGYVELEADSVDEAIAHAEDGFNIDQFQCTDVEVDEATRVIT